VQVRLDALAQARDEVERIDEGQQRTSDP